MTDMLNLIDRDHLWAVVLAGGEGVRLQPLVRHVCGDERPKQYVPLLGSRSLLRQTVDRAARLVPADRTIVVTLQDHAAYVAAEPGRDEAFASWSSRKRVGRRPTKNRRPASTRRSMGLAGAAVTEPARSLTQDLSGAS